MLLEEIQFGLSGQSMNCPIEPGLDPEQPINNINKNKSNVQIPGGNFRLGFGVFMFVLKLSIRNAL
jgi:hypothetical protein